AAGTRRFEAAMIRQAETPAGISESPTQDLFGVPIHAVTFADVMAHIDDAIRWRRQLLIGVVNAAKVVNMRRNTALRESVLSADLILADGMSVVWAARLLGRRLPERIAGIDLMIRMLERSNEKGYRVFCLGATREVVSAVADRIRQEYPNLQLVGQHDGYFTE